MSDLIGTKVSHREGPALSGPAPAADSEWLVRHRATIYLGINGVAFLAAIIGAPVNDVPFGVAVYVCLLVALCSAPLLLMTRLNDRYMVAGIFMAAYFLVFGALDLQILLLGTDRLQAARPEFMTAPELAILAGAASVLLGSTLAVSLTDSGHSEGSIAEWPVAATLTVGLALFLVGTAASLYFQIVVAPAKLGFAAAKGLATMSPALTFMVMLGQMLQPVGALILAYGYAKYRGFLWTALTVAIVATQVIVAFVEDIKAQAIIAGVLVILTRVVVTNRVPKTWLVYTAVFLMVGFPIFQAYRTVSGERGLDRAQALQQLDRVIEGIMSVRAKASDSRVRSETFLERSSVKANLGILFEHVGQDVPYLNGSSLVSIPYAFVPRLLAPDKEDLNIGQLFGKQILKSDSGVYISISHLGELYWNFGWSGVIGGMGVLGVILGVIGAKCNPRRGTTLTRVLILVATIKTLCIGFEGTLPISYVLWMRSLLAIGLLHWMFARIVPTSAAAASSVPPTDDQPRQKNAALPVLSSPRFPNLLR